MLFVYGSGLYAGIDFMNFIIQSWLSFCIEVISPAQSWKTSVL